MSEFREPEHIPEHQLEGDIQDGPPSEPHLTAAEVSRCAGREPPEWWGEYCDAEVEIKKIARFYILHCGIQSKDAEDLLQEVKVELCSTEVDQSHVENLVGLFATTLRFRAIDAQRKEARRAQRSHLSTETDVPGGATIGEGLVDHREELPCRAVEANEFIESTTSPLPPASRRIFYAKVIEGRTFREIAETEQISQSSAKRRCAATLADIRRTAYRTIGPKP